MKLINPEEHYMSTKTAEKIDTQVIRYASGLPAAMEKEYAIPLCNG